MAVISERWAMRQTDDPDKSKQLEEGRRSDHWRE